MNEVELFHHHFCVWFYMWYKRLFVNESHITKRITYCRFESLKLEWGYGKLCVMWIGVCAVAWNLERVQCGTR